MSEEKESSNGGFPNKLLREFAREYAQEFFELDTAITHQSSKNKLNFFSKLNEAAVTLKIEYDSAEALKYVGPFLNNQRNRKGIKVLSTSEKEEKEKKKKEEKKEKRRKKNSEESNKEGEEKKNEEEEEELQVQSKAVQGKAAGREKKTGRGRGRGRGKGK